MDPIHLEPVVFYQGVRHTAWKKKALVLFFLINMTESDMRAQTKALDADVNIA